jgi:hypothetical protein
VAIDGNPAGVINESGSPDRLRRAVRRHVKKQVELRARPAGELDTPLRRLDRLHLVLGVIGDGARFHHGAHAG